MRSNAPLLLVVSLLVVGWLAVGASLYRAFGRPVGGVTLGSLGVTPKGAEKQPLAFNHKAHIEAEDMECLDCHLFADKGPHATLPRLKNCADCHSEPQGEHPDEAKVREYMEAAKEINWVTVNRLPGHVYFSHRPHVVNAKMQCWDCHGDLRKVSRAVTRPDIHHLTMAKCMECHWEKKAANECSTCHK